MFASTQVPGIFIDKFNVSGIEIMIPDWPSQEIAPMGRQSTGETVAAKEHLNYFHFRGLAAI
jgi:hypothetical protein